MPYQKPDIAGKIAEYQREIAFHAFERQFIDWGLARLAEGDLDSVLQELPTAGRRYAQLKRESQEGN